MKRAELRTGNKLFNSGAYTLLEILLAVSVIAIGTAFIFPSFFKSSDLLANLSGRYTASLVANNLFADTQSRLRRDAGLSVTPVKGRVEQDGKSFTYSLTSEPLNAEKRLYEVIIVLEWQDFKKNQLSRSFYVSR